jgi:hypothetical protein
LFFAAIGTAAGFWLVARQRRRAGWHGHDRSADLLPTARELEAKASEPKIEAPSPPLAPHGASAPPSSNRGAAGSGAQVARPLFRSSIRQYKCKLCSFVAARREDVESHAANEHLDEYIEAMTYQEIAETDESLPRGIYKCNYCPAYVESSDPSNPTTAIINHILDRCEMAPRDSRPSHISFRAITNAEEVRTHVRKHLPVFHRCRLCGQRMSGALRSERINHLVTVHRDSLFEAL